MTEALAALGAATLIALANEVRRIADLRARRTGRKRTRRSDRRERKRW